MMYRVLAIGVVVAKYSNGFRQSKFTPPLLTKPYSSPSIV
jgi:hypothetical protein